LNLDAMVADNAHRAKTVLIMKVFVLIVQKDAPDGEMGVNRLI